MSALRRPDAAQRLSRPCALSLAALSLAALRLVASRRKAFDARKDTEQVDDDCLLCRVGDADAHFRRRRVWEDEHWRLSVVLQGAVVGFAHLEPHRHIPFITDLDGPEAATLGATLARATNAVRTATAAGKVYVYVFGDRVPHLHFNLAPHHPGDALTGGPGLIRPNAQQADPTAHLAAATAIEYALTPPPPRS
jgi:diadenosine tetraphosphate (Ap4A) HIT family hydrolase